MAPKGNQPNRGPNFQKIAGNVYGTARGNRPKALDKKREEEMAGHKSRKEIEKEQELYKLQLEKERKAEVDAVELAKMQEPKPIEQSYSLIKNPKTMRYERVSDLDKRYAADPPLGQFFILKQNVQKYANFSHFNCLFCSHRFFSVSSAR